MISDIAANIQNRAARGDQFVMIHTRQMVHFEKAGCGGDQALDHILGHIRQIHSDRLAKGVECENALCIQQRLASLRRNLRIERNQAVDFFDSASNSSDCTDQPLVPVPSLAGSL